jgi:adenylate cyclase
MLFRPALATVAPRTNIRTIMAAPRRLAAIFAADVAGYSRLMGADEEGTLERLKAHRRQLVDPKIGEHRGRIVKTTGDGMLVEFPSVVDAVRCAVEVQRGMLDRERERDADQRIRFRVGINLGDVIVDGDDIFGDGVNVAARLEGLAEPGGICISGAVRDHVGDRLPYAFADMGEQSVKNIARPVHAYAMDAAAVAATALTAVQAQPGWARRVVTRPAFIGASLVAVVAIVIAAWWIWPNAGSLPVAIQTQASPQSAPGSANIKPAPRLSIVVLPFTNLSNDPEQEYFADGMTDDLTTDLSRIQDSFVIARTTAFTYKGKPIDVRQIGRELNVRYVLEGSVRRSGEQVQINVQLIDAETGSHVWADRFDSARSNLAKAQNEITSLLARTLHLELAEAVGRQIEREAPVNPDARDLVMRGWAWFYRPVSATQLQEAQRAFDQALAMDPESVDARAGIASVLLNAWAAGFTKSPQQDTARADELLTEALERDSNHARALFGLGWVRRYQNRLIESRIALEKAVALDRNFAGAMVQLGFTLSALGEFEAALPHFEKALQLSPRDPNQHWYYNGMGTCHLGLGHADEAVDFMRKARAGNPRVYQFPLFLAAALGLRGDIDEAKSALADFLKFKPEINSIAKVRAHFPAFENPRIVALAENTTFVGLRRAGLPDE